jgi:hypothetical protein
MNWKHGAKPGVITRKQTLQKFWLVQHLLANFVSLVMHRDKILVFNGIGKQSF